MVKKAGVQIQWLAAPEPQDYPAAKSYLSLLLADKQVAAVLGRLKKAKPQAFKVKDIFRASRLSLLGVSNAHVERDKRKIKKGQKLSPLLLVRQQGGAVIIADGYHRMCAVYQFDEDAMIPCRIV